MPPKPKFTKEEIVTAALNITREKGIDAVTAREIAAKLGSSARPIFTVFRNMNEVQQEVRHAAMEYFGEFTQKAINYTPAFKQFGMQMIIFANEEPKLFQLLFMTENEEAKNFEEVFANLGGVAEFCIEVICTDYGLTKQDAELLFRNMWINTFGIGVLCANRVCGFSVDEINEILGQEFMAMMMFIKSGALGMRPVVPVPKNYNDKSDMEEQKNDTGNKTAAAASVGGN